MKKKLILTFILVLMGVFYSNATIVMAKTEGIYTYEILNGEVTITECDKNVSGKIIIPDTIGGYPVTLIGDSSFSGCTGIVNIIIPDSVIRIGNYAFNDCTYLVDVTIPDSVTSIGDGAFYTCSNLASITIPDSVTSIGDEAFYGCSNLASITIPNSVMSMGDWMFGECYNLVNVTIPNSVTSIGNSAFNGCSNLASITIPDGVISIGVAAFAGCNSLVSITIPDSVTNIGDWVFANCKNLVDVTVGKGIEIIPEKAFYSSNLKCIVLPTKVKYIRNGAFNGCSNMEIVFYAGSESQWNEVLIYSVNSYLVEAKKIYNAMEKTYTLETNCDIKLENITDYAVFSVPTVTSEGKTLLGWYDNESLRGNPVTFPYYGDATTLYAAWTDRTGKSFDDAFIAKANQEYTVTTTESEELVYFEFVPKSSKEHRFYTTGDRDTYGYLYDSNQVGLTEDTNSGDGSNFYISYDLTAGETYYIAVKLCNGTGTFTLVAEEPADYRINEITIKDMSGNSLGTIPTGTFFATVSFTNVSSTEDAVIMLAEYSESGIFKGLMYIQTEDVPTGSTIKLSIPVDNSKDDIAKLKAFCWDSIGSATPTGNSVSFPEE